MSVPPLLSVFVGAGTGACLRYALSRALNPWWPTLPLGTLVANLVGGYLVGLLGGWFLVRLAPSPSLQALLVPGLLGGLTTFSAFSLEVVLQAQAGRTGAAALMVAAHVGGSLLLTVAGLWTARVVFAG